jgi:hypothetical protein
VNSLTLSVWIASAPARSVEPLARSINVSLCPASAPGFSEDLVFAAKFTQTLEAVPDVGVARDGRQYRAFATAAHQNWDLE